eukprot:m.285132 g.285132  ORF g.285132 m.285132 type:complete len:129 (-) comp11305_c0_seq1:172-558(-)
MTTTSYNDAYLALDAPAFKALAENRRYPILASTEVLAEVGKYSNKGFVFSYEGPALVLPGSEAARPSEGGEPVSSAVSYTNIALQNARDRFPLLRCVIVVGKTREVFLRNMYREVDEATYRVLKRLYV